MRLQKPPQFARQRRFALWPASPPALSMEKEQDSQTDPTLTSRFFSKADPQRKKQTRFPAKRVVFPGEFPVQTPATSGAFS